MNDSSKIIQRIIERSNAKWKRKGKKNRADDSSIAMVYCIKIFHLRFKLSCSVILFCLCYFLIIKLNLIIFPLCNKELMSWLSSVSCREHIICHKLFKNHMFHISISMFSPLVFVWCNNIYIWVQMSVEI